MTTKNIFKGLAVAVCFSTMLSACTAKFEDYNTNKHEATEEMMENDNLKTGALFRQIQRAVFFFRDGTYLDSDYQVMNNLLADTYAGYFAPTLAANNGVHCGSYFMTEGWRRAMFVNKYTYAMNAWQKLAKTATDLEQAEVLALANIMKVATMHQVTDYYGPVPYSKVGLSLNAEYDSQEDIYNQFFEELGDAIDVLNAFKNGNPGVTLMAQYDYVYGGNVESWIKFANSLRLRLAMRVVYADPALAQEQAELSVNDQTGVITAAAERPVLPSSLVNHHPVYEINVNFNDGDCQMAASMDVFLNGYNDPRGTIYFKKAADDKLHGVRNGVHASNWANYRNAAGKVSAPNSLSQAYSITWLHASEVAFLRAEGALRGWNMGGTAQEFYEKGIKLSFEEMGAGDATAYIANATAKPADFKDNVSSNSMTALTDVTIAWEAGANFERSLEKIMTQKWLAIFPNGCEAWAEYRRTGYPQLLPVVNNDSQGVVNTNLQIRRVPFPHDEYTNNAAGVATGVAKLNGLDNAGTKLWWDKKPR